MKTFKAGQELSTRSICDHECIFTGEVISRTKKTVTIYTRMHGTERKKIFLDIDGHEMVYPFGQYSMAPTFRA